MAEQVEATVLKVGQSPLLLVAQSCSFPTQEILISEVIDGNINSSILYDGIIYYCSETQDALVTAANIGGTATLPILKSPDNTLWFLGVDNNGALTTTQVAEGTPNTINLFSLDGTEWNVTITNNGALQTTIN